MTSVVVSLFTLAKFENCYDIYFAELGDTFPSKQIHAQNEQ